MRMRAFQHPSLPPFAVLVDGLLGAISNADLVEPPAQLVAIHARLAQAHASALLLPSTSGLFDASDGSPDREDERDPVPEAPGPSLPPVDLSRLAAYLGPLRYYREIFDPYAADSGDPVVGDLLDDLQDIHHELSAGLAHWRRGNAGEALWAWRFGFESHWCEHATSALRALFALSAWHGFPWPND